MTPRPTPVVMPQLIVSDMLSTMLVVSCQGKEAYACLLCIMNPANTTIPIVIPDNALNILF